MKPTIAIASFGILSLILAAAPGNTVDNRASQALKQEVARLAARLSALEKSKNRVSAPFEVVGADGVIILRVGSLLGDQSLGARVTIGGGREANYALRVFNESGQNVAGIGEALNQKGGAVAVYENGEDAASLYGPDRSVFVRNASGEIVAQLSAQQNFGVVGVYQNSQPVAYLTKSSSGAGGNITALTANGGAAFSAGAASDGGGEACVNRVTSGGQVRAACLGVGLPGMGTGQ